MVPASGFPLVHVDDAAVARLAADHFRERGFRRFAFYGIRGETWSEQRREAFVGYVEQFAPRPDVFEISRHALQTSPWEGRQDRLARWLAGLAKPVGLLISSDQRGPDVLEACRRGGVLVPEEMAVVGVDNDEPLCEVCNPPLSSVVPNHYHVGYQAAALLDDLMKGHPTPTETRLIAPQGVITRTSSDALAVDDPLVAAALRFIRAAACNNIGVDSVVQEAGTSRSVLQRRFRLSLGRTIHDQIVSQRIKHAVELITGTELPLATIAEKCGFHHQEYMGAVFKARLGRSPAQVRKRHGRLQSR
jgi:LacI family transcriptional regulator